MENLDINGLTHIVVLLGGILGICKMFIGLIEKRIDKLEAGQETIKDGFNKRLTNLETELKEVKNNQVKLEDGQAKLEDGQAKLEDGQVKLNKRMDDAIEFAKAFLPRYIDEVMESKIKPEIEKKIKEGLKKKI